MAIVSIVVPQVFVSVYATYSIRGKASKARRDLKALFARYGFQKEAKAPIYHRLMPYDEWSSFSGEFGTCVETLSKYATFVSIKLWLNGELVYDLGAVEPLRLQKAA